MKLTQTKIDDQTHLMNVLVTLETTQNKRLILLESIKLKSDSYDLTGKEPKYFVAWGNTENLEDGLMGISPLLTKKLRPVKKLSSAMFQFRKFVSAAKKVNFKL